MLRSPRTTLLLLSLLAASCKQPKNEALTPPPPLPTAKAPEAPKPDTSTTPPGAANAEQVDQKRPANEAPESARRAAQPEAPRNREPTPERKASPAASGGVSLYELAKRGEATLETSKPKTGASANVPAKTQPPEPSAPAPISKPAPAPPKPKSKVDVPSTAHVRVDVPAGLQRALDADPRMQPWVRTVITVADGCQRQNPAAVGTIKVRVTMHENERPDADILSLPSQLSPIVACATGRLMRTKMPLFTAREGERHSVSIHFSR